MDRAFTRSPESAWSNDPGLRAEKITTRLQEELEEGRTSGTSRGTSSNQGSRGTKGNTSRCSSRGTSRERLREMLIVKGHFMGTLKWASRGLHFKGASKRSFKQASNLALTSGCFRTSKKNMKEQKTF